MLAEISIRSLGGLGDGIAEYDGKPLFVPKACVGDRLKVRITQNSAQHARGQIVAVLSPGPERTTPPCPHFSDCGGCTLQQLEPQAYRKLKQQVVLNALHHAGYDTTPAPMLFIPAGSRRRVEMRLHRKDGKLSAAYYMPGTHTLLPVEHCLLLNADLQGFLPRLLAALEYWPHTEAIKSFKLTALDGGVELVLCIANNIPRPALTALAGSLDTARLCSERQSIYVINEPKPLTIRLGDYDVPLPPDSFLQATEAAQSALTHTVQEHTKDANDIADLFCGIGTYGFALVDNAHVHGVELHDGMTGNLTKAIATLGLQSRFSTETRDLFKNPLSGNELNRFDAVVINPPRPGAKTQTEAIAKSPVPLVVMVSCSPASWARDADILRQAGFTLDFVQGIDQFVYSPHLEIASVFSR